MNNLHIENSYSIWSRQIMYTTIRSRCYTEYNSWNVEEVFNRSIRSMYVEWWLHNIGYYLTKPFCFIDPIEHINNRCKDVDLQEWE